MIINLEWRIPWDETVKPENRKKAADKLVSYINEGTMYEVTKRMKAHARVGGTDTDPFLYIDLEN